MALRDDISKILGAPMEFVFAEFAVAATIRRRTQAATDDPDGSVNVQGSVIEFNETARLVISAQTKGAAQRQWGLDTVVTMQGLVETLEDVRRGDFLRPLAGDFTGLWFQVLEARPVDMGLITMLGMLQVPAPPLGA